MVVEDDEDVDDAAGADAAGVLVAAGVLDALLLSLDDELELLSVDTAAAGLSAFAALSDFPPSDFGADPLTPFG